MFSLSLKNILKTFQAVSEASIDAKRPALQAISL